jgi:ABC-type nitrate/sulfonate/bicarbonate transport system substrate-binding protein
MAAAVATGEIDAFRVGEPWGAAMVESGAGELILPSCANLEVHAGKSARGLPRLG